MQLQVSVGAPTTPGDRPVERVLPSRAEDDAALDAARRGSLAAGARTRTDLDLVAVAAGRRRAGRPRRLLRPAWPSRPASPTARCSRACGPPGAPATTSTPRWPCPRTPGAPLPPSALHPALLDAALHAIGLVDFAGDGAAPACRSPGTGCACTRPAPVPAGAAVRRGNLRSWPSMWPTAPARRWPPSAGWSCGAVTADALRRGRRPSRACSLYTVNWTPVPRTGGWRWPTSRQSATTRSSTGPERPSRTPGSPHAGGR